MATSARPFITANQVTLLRIALLPVPCALILYGPLSWQWFAIGLYVALGFTDLLDGWMARQWGGTVLGALLDPVADKVFMAAALIPMSALHLVHPAVVVIILIREFLITSLRSAMSLRGKHVKTSILAKLKTSVQMGGSFVVYVVYRLPAKDEALIALGSVSVVAAAILVWRYLATRRFNPLVVVPCCLVIVAFLVRAVVAADVASHVYWAVIVLFTVGSAVDYLGGAWTVLAKGAGHHLNDLGRILWSIAGGCGIPLLVAWRPEISPIGVVLLSTELATGAVDNLRCHESFLPHWWIFPLRAAALGAGGWLALSLAHDGTAWSPAFWAATGLAALLFLWTLLDFIVARHLIWGTDAPPADKAKGSVGR